MLYQDFLIKFCLVKSTTDIHHSTQCLANERIDCGKLCMSFKNKDMCLHITAVAIYRD